jgi:anti-anti-sigma regulatory factor
MHIVSLPKKCDRVAAQTFAQHVRELLHQGDIAVDGSAVRQIGQAMLQTLVSARTSVSQAGHRFDVTASEPMLRACRLTGLESHIL